MKDWFQEQVTGRIREVTKSHGTERSKSWRKTRKRYLSYHRKCAVCGTKKALNVHHIVPFHIDPSLELEISNLITLCRKHHFFVGHLNFWCSWNVNVVSDCATWRDKLSTRPRKEL